MLLVRTGIIFLLIYPGLLTMPADAKVVTGDRGRPHAERADDGQKGREKHARGPKDNRRDASDDIRVVARPREGHAVVRSRDDYAVQWRGRPDAWMDRDHSVIVIHRYYDTRGLPPGLAKKGKLPPGLRKQLRERDHLPPGLDRYWVVLPIELERDLPPLPPHHARRIIGNDLAIVDLRLNLIVSLWPGVFGR